MGIVTFVGAGPGSADLITVRGLRAIQQADCILYDALIDSELLNHAPLAVKIPVGKRAGKASTEQSFINQSLVESAKRYKHVVRLKGGDPSIFGRLDEELNALDAVSIEYTIVPGVTSACAAAAQIKRPLTQRGVARRIVFATSAAGQDEAGNQTMQSLSPAHADTLALYMAGRDRASIARRLLQQGWSSDTPVALVWDAGSTSSGHQQLTLGEMAWAQPVSQTDAPLMVLIGAAVGHAPATESEGIKAHIASRQTA
jgi:uroporphyrin-III C-methyltransferase